MSVTFATKYTNPHSHFKQSQLLTLLMNLRLDRVPSDSLASVPFSSKWGNPRAGTDFQTGGPDFFEGLFLMYLMVVSCQLGLQRKLPVRTPVCGPVRRAFRFLTEWRLGLHEQVSQDTGSGATSFLRLRPGNWNSQRPRFKGRGHRPIP